MKRLSSMYMLLVSLGFVFLAPIASAANDYTVVCNSDGNMKTNYIESHNVGSGQRDRVRIRLEFQFKKAPTAAGVRQPAPGECAWVDRPFNTKEASRLTLYSDYKRGDFTVSFQGNRLAEINSSNPTVLKLITALRKPGIFYLRVGLGKITRFGP